MPRLVVIAVGSEGQRSALSVLLDHLHSFLFGGGGGDGTVSY